MFEYKIIWAHIRKHVTAIDIAATFVISACYGALRMFNLGHFPIFSDEGIYIMWAKIAANDANWRFISLTDGKQPLQTWLTIPFFKIISDPLVAGRMVSVLTGFVAMAGIFTLLTYLFNKKTGYIGAVLYVVTPYFLFYDRMALIDSGVSAAFVWILFLSILLVRTNRLDVALIYGLTGGVALLAKSSIRLFMQLSVLAPIVVFSMNRKKFINHAINYWFLFGFGAIIAFVIYNIQRLSPFFYFIELKNNTFLLTTSQFLHDPFKVVFNNLPLVPYYIFSELGYVVGILGIAGLILLIKKDWKLGAYFAIWLIAPYIGISLFAQVLFPRYIIFFATELTILAAYFISVLPNKKSMIMAFIAVALSVTYFNYTILVDNKAIPFPPVDKGQYIMDWPAGWGIKEVVEYARAESPEKKPGNKPVYILAEGNFGKSGDVLNTLHTKDDTFTVEGIWPLNLDKVIETKSKLDKYNVLVMFHRRKEFPPDWPLEQIMKVDYPDVCNLSLLDKMLHQTCPERASLYLFKLTK